MSHPLAAPVQPPSVADVARLAGVSPATVSRAFNTPALLGAATLERVQRAAQQLGYQPYGLARSLRRRRSMVVGVVMPSLRYAYYAGIPLLFLALVTLAADKKALATLLFAIVGLAFLANAGLGVYHAGAEWGFWPGPDTCASGPAKLSLNAKDFAKPGTAMNVVRCDQAAWRFLGISFAGYNVLISLLIAYGCAFAARQVSGRI